jgi:hypothetical protein
VRRCSKESGDEGDSQPREVEVRAAPRWCRCGEFSCLNFAEVVWFVGYTSGFGSSSGDSSAISSSSVTTRTCSGHGERVRWRAARAQVHRVCRINGQGGQQSSFYRGLSRHGHKDGRGVIQSHVQSRL